mmetsp:Transcript_116040/g.200691  ORF Transcript_116040/g.200691 Transcript_116040/m.200691 type:complete len:291 (-) Transcript_116040:552-1424(-)
MHSKVGVDITNLVCVDVLQQQQEDRVRNIRKHDLLLVAGSLTHAAVEEGTKMFRACGEVCPSGVDRLSLHQECHIRKRWVVDELAQILHEIAGRNRDRLEAELVEVVQNNTPVVATKDVQRIVVHLCNKGRPTTRWVLGAHDKPCTAVEPELVQVIQSLLATVATKKKQGVAINNACMEISWRGHLTSRSHRGPSPRSHAKLVEVVHSMNAVIAPEEVHRPVVHCPRRAAPARRDEPLHLCRAPHAPLEIKVEHIIEPSRAIIAAKDVHEIAMNGRHIAKSRRWNITFVT